MRITAIGVPLLRIGTVPRDRWVDNTDPSIALTQDRFVDVDPSTFTPDARAEFENFRMRGLIGLHPDDNDGIPLGKFERATLPTQSPTAPPRPPATPAPPADDEEDEPARPHASADVTKDEKPSGRRSR